MSPEETALLEQFGRSVVFNIIFINMEMTFLWGVHATLTIAALVVLRRRGLRTKHLKFLFIMLFLLLSLSTSVVALRWAETILRLEYTLVKHIDLDLQSRIMIASSVLKNMKATSAWLSSSPNLMYLIGDLVVLIRGYILWVMPKAWFIVPAFLLMASFALTVASRELLTHFVVANSDPAAITGMSAMACSIASNAFVTAMIAYQAIKHRQALKRVAGLAPLRMPPILFYMVEAGFLFFIIQVITLVLLVLDVEAFTPVDYGAIGFQTFSYYVSITYPAMVILLVTYNRSIADDKGFTGPGSQTLDAGTHISFVKPGVSQEREISTSRESHHMSAAWTVDAELSRQNGSEDEADDHARTKAGERV